MHVRVNARKVDRGSIAAAASHLIRRQGVEGVSMRAVATALGVTPMALYGHYDSSAALRRAGVSVALRVVRPPPFDGSVETRLREWAHAARRVLRRYPDLAAVCLTGWPELPEGCRIMEGLLAVAADHTTRSADQVGIANAIFEYVLTRVIAERAAMARGSRWTAPAAEARPRQFARLVRMQGEFRTLDAERDFALGLEALLERVTSG